MMPHKPFKTMTFVALMLSALAFFGLHPAAPPAAPPAAAAPQGEVESAAAAAVSPVAAQALARLRSASGVAVMATSSPRTGVYDFVRAQGGPTAVLASANALASPESRARAFLAEYGGLLGMTALERQLAGAPAPTAPTADASALQFVRAKTDRAGATHVKFQQTYRGMKVLGGQLVVHLSALGVTGVNGNYVPGVNVGKTPKVTAARAGTVALSSLRKSPAQVALRVVRTELGVYRVGLLEGFKGRNRLAHAVTVAASTGDTHQVWVDAQNGDVLNQISLTPHALYRLIFNQSYSGDDSQAIIDEGNPLKPAPPLGTTEAGDLYHYAGHTYNMMSSGFGFDSYDQQGGRMRSVLIYPDNPAGDPTKCPNATWNGQTTNFCTEVNSDDVVSHEWGHAYTQYTHDLIYSYQSGALNESYSDILGEALDLLNNHDQPDAVTGGLPDNTRPTAYTTAGGQYVPSGGGVRWRVGEDVQGLNQPAALGILRDMWTPVAFGDPDKVSSSLYHCDAADGGGVHTNSGIPNHAFAMLVDGKTYNGVTVQPIGLVRALNIYVRAMDVYQVASTNFAQHEQALVASCNDLIGQPLNSLSTSTPVSAVTTETITAQTCQQVQNAMHAVEMSQNPTARCNFKKLLDPATPASCDGNATVWAEDWETGADGWTLGHEGTGPEFPGTDWAVRSELPANPDGSPRAGSAAFAANPRIGEPNGGTCQPGGDVSGRFWMDSPEVTVPANAQDLKVAFEHFVQTENEYDGGNLKVSVNGGDFIEVPRAQYVFNPPNFAIGSNNPMTDQQLWVGANEGELSGSWGTTIADLSTLTDPGDKVRLRFEFGQDACNGNLGWFVDAVRLYSCPFLDAPALSVAADYGNPDRDGRYTLQWTRPAGAAGPDLVQESTSCGPAFADDAEEMLSVGTTSQNSKWSGSAQWKSIPDGASMAYFIPAAAMQNESLTMKNAVAIPAGASAALSFRTRQGLEDTFDFARVEVSTDGGQTFTEVAKYTGPPEATLPTSTFEGTRAVDLSRFAGQSVKLRFRLTSDEYTVGLPAGWYVDDIRLTATTFRDVATVEGTSYTFRRQADGNYCYRVATAYEVAGQTARGPFSNVADVSVANVACLTNVAASAAGATATASSVYPNAGFSAAGAIDGNRAGASWGANGGWNDGTRGLFPDWLEVNFGGARRLREVRVYTLANDFSGNPQEPTAATPASLYGLVDFDVQFWDGAQWVTAAAVNGNDKAVRAVALDDVTTDRVRVLVRNSREHYSRIVEVEAIGCEAQP